MDRGQIAPGQEPADPRRVITAFQNLDAVERLTSSSEHDWCPCETDELAQQLRNLALAGILELNPFERPDSNGLRSYRPEFTTLGALTVFDVLGVARSHRPAGVKPPFASATQRNYGATVTETKQYPQTFFQPNPGACQILLVRHGQSAPFVEGTPFPLVDGQGDPPLSPLGEWQAEQVGQRLSSEPIDAIYATSLQRTRQTAQPLATALDLQVNIEPDLREVHLGVGEGGLFRKMSAEGHPSTVAMRVNREWGEVEGAESNAQFAGRTVPALQRLATAHSDQLIAVFVHGGTIGSLLGHALGINMFNMMGSRNSAISHVVVDNDQWVVRSFNDAAHSGPLTADAEPPT